MKFSIIDINILRRLYKIMGSLFLYSTNPWYSHEVAMRYLSGSHCVWCSDYYDPSSASSISASALIAPSSSPKGIYNQLFADCESEDTHSSLIRGYKKTFKRLASSWVASGVITDIQKQEIIATVNSSSWKIWRPVLYIIYRPIIESSGRLNPIPLHMRASYGNEWKIDDLKETEFEIIER